MVSNKRSGDNSSLEEEFKSLEAQFINLCGMITYHDDQVEELRERVEKLEHPEYHENEDFSNKLSIDAQKIVQGSRGPLKPGECLKLFTDDTFAKNKKEALIIIRKYSDKIDAVKNQFSRVLENIENRVASRKRENALDDTIIKKIRKFNKMVDEEREKEMKANERQRVQKTKNQVLGKNAYDVSSKNNKTLLKVKTAEKRDFVNQNNYLKMVGKESMKRKRRNDEDDTDSCSGPEVEVEQITANIKKRLKLNVPQESNAEKSNVKSNAKDKSVTFKHYREQRTLMSPIGSEDSQSSHSSRSSRRSRGTSEDESYKRSIKVETVPEKQLQIRKKAFLDIYKGVKEYGQCSSSYFKK